jgi:hypothetical protein
MKKHYFIVSNDPMEDPIHWAGEDTSQDIKRLQEEYPERGYVFRMISGETKTDAIGQDFFWDENTSLNSRKEFSNYYRILVDTDLDEELIEELINDDDLLEVVIVIRSEGMDNIMPFIFKACNCAPLITERRTRPCRLVFFFTENRSCGYDITI